VSRVGLGFRLTQNLGFLRKVRCEPLSLFFGVWILTSLLFGRVSPWCPCANIFV
jgi:hypothetical protein